ncbi:MAG: hypothetical protein GY903_02675 [Fuerstiella sp.]|nr:hypothetical protein [Fuerstiella sp.]MCP4853382.1 hypothetical protein [Fuerstiella sp.]
MLNDFARKIAVAMFALVMAVVGVGCDGGDSSDSAAAPAVGESSGSDTEGGSAGSDSE